MTRTDLIKKIHVLKHAANLDDENYRTILHAVTGKSSSANMDEEELNLCILALKKFCIAAMRKNERQHKMIARLMQHLNWKWSNTAKFCERITHKNNTRLCTTQELNNLIRGLIGVIDHDLKTGKIIMTPAALQEYHFKTNSHRSHSSTNRDTIASSDSIST